MKGLLAEAQAYLEHASRVLGRLQSAESADTGDGACDRGRLNELGTLSRRELQVLSLLLDGKRVPSIAKALTISPHTVRSHLKAIFRKSGVRSQSDLVERFASSCTLEKRAPGKDKRQLHPSTLSVGLLSGQSSTVRHLCESMLEERKGHRDWCRVADRIAELYVEVSKQWEEKQTSLVDRYRMTARLRRAIGRCCELMPPPHIHKLWLLLTPNCNEHALALSLFELCVRELGAGVVWAASTSPRTAVAELVSSPAIASCTISALSTTRSASNEYLDWLGSLCESKGCELLLVGPGPWPETSRFGRRVRTYAELARSSHS